MGIGEEGRKRREELGRQEEAKNWVGEERRGGKGSREKNRKRGGQ